MATRVSLVRKSAERAFTLIELVIVIVIIAIAVAFTAYNTGTVSFWREEGFIRRLSETFVFLHHQAVVDQAYYRFEIDLEKSVYQVGVLQAEAKNETGLAALSSDAGTITLELAAMLSPSLSGNQAMIPPPSFPSLADPVPFPQGLKIVDVRTMRGKTLASDAKENPYILFSPRGFSEFAVLHLEDSRKSPITILINPFTGLTEVYREYKDFTWTYTKEKGNDA